MQPLTSQAQPAKPEAEFALQEAKTARESAEKRALDLELELTKLRNDYAELRSKYADLLINSHEAVEKLRKLELKAAHLLQNDASHEIRDSENAALMALEENISRLNQANAALAAFHRFLDSWLNAVNPSQTAKEQLLEALADVRHSLGGPQSTAPTTLKNEGRGRTARVEAYKQELGVYILDKGLLAGVTVGSDWRLEDVDGKILARLKVVAARPGASAAVLVQGSPENVPLGSALRAGK